jgi:hypothetical protein
MGEPFLFYPIFQYFTIPIFQNKERGEENGNDTG